MASLIILFKWQAKTKRTKYTFSWLYFLINSVKLKNTNILSKGKSEQMLFKEISAHNKAIKRTNKSGASHALSFAFYFNRYV